MHFTTGVLQENRVKSTECSQNLIKQLLDSTKFKTGIHFSSAVLNPLKPKI